MSCAGSIDQPIVAIDGTANGATGATIENVRILSYVNSGTTPAIHLLNAVQARISNVYLSNNGGPGVLLEGNGTGIEDVPSRCIIEESLYVVSGIADADPDQGRACRLECLQHCHHQWALDQLWRLGNR